MASASVGLSGLDEAGPCGVTGVVRGEHGNVLLLRRRLWPPGRQWEFPTGYAIKGEQHEDTIQNGCLLRMAPDISRSPDRTEMTANTEVKSHAR